MSETPVPLLDAEAHQPPTRAALADLQARLAALLPDAAIEEVGATAIPGALSKGDLDVCVIVEPAAHATTVARLQAAGYAVKDDTLRTPELCMLVVPGVALDVAVQVVARGSRFEGVFIGFRDALRADPAWVARYNALKREFAPQGATRYRAEKARFVAEVLAAQPLQPSLQARLREAYAERHRAYHTTQHLDECLAEFERVRHLAHRPREVEAALWFHDAIYDVQRHDNEARSADWARAELTRTGLSDDAIERIVALVLATRHSVAPQTADEQLLVDIDLAILGAAPQRFAEYERQIRAEYAHVPEAVFRTKRAEILTGFAARPQLYGTPALRERFEAAARRNLAQAIEGLAAGRG